MRTQLAAALILALMAACSDPPKQPESTATSNSNRGAGLQPPEPPKPATRPDPSFKSCNEYYPVVPGSTAKYSISYSSGLQADATIVTDQVEENGQTLFKERSLILDQSGGLRINQKSERKLFCDGERIMLLAEKTESDIEGNRTVSNMNYRENSVLIADKASLGRKGFSWSYALRPTFENTAAGGGPATVSEPVIVTLEAQGEAQVTVPAGTFTALKLQRKVNQNISWDYLVPGLGLVRREAAEGTSWTLKEYSGLKALN
jgi:hypothetical protein